MQTKCSFFHKTIFWHDLKRFWPLTAGYTLLWLLILPLERFTALNHHRAANVFSAQYEALEVAVTGGYVVAFFSGILFAMAAFSYLESPRATNGLHALPARRETLYVTHYLAGLCAQLAPQALTVLLTAAVLGANGCGGARVTGLLFAMCLPTVFFYSFGALCMVVAGQMLAAPVFYGVLNLLAVAVEFLVYLFAGNFLYGWSDHFDARTRYFSPLFLLLSGEAPRAARLNHYAPLSGRDGEAAIPYGVTIERWQLLLLYAAVGLVLAALGLLLYRTRPSEATGSTVAIGWIRPIFKYGVAVCAALALGQLLYYLFFGQYRANGSYSLAGALLCMAAAGLVGYFTAEMLLKKSFRVWRSGWRGAVCFTALLLVFGGAVSLDPLGYERYVPDETAVESAHVSLYLQYSDVYGNAVLTDAAQLRLVAAAHRALVADKARQQRGGWNGEEENGVCHGGFAVNYTLRGGRVVRRDYDFTIYESELDDPASPAAALTALCNDPAVALIRALSGQDLRALDDLRITGGHYYTARPDDAGEPRDVTERDLTAAEAQAIYDAAARDAAAGRAACSLFARAEDTRDYTSVVLYATYLPREPSPDAMAPMREADGRASMEIYLHPLAGMTETAALLGALAEGAA